MDYKKCTVCKTEKPISEFGKYRKKKDGIHYRCMECNREIGRVQYKKNRKSRLALQKANYEANKDRCLAYAKAWHARNKRKTKDALLRNSFGQDFGIEQFEALMKEQGGVCAICGENKHNHRYETMHLCVDHDHETGKIRGLLCQYCNRGLGFLGDTKGSLQRAVDYLVRSSRAS